MCGIVGAVARRNVVPILLEGLRRLEYRGYDSAGVAVINSGMERLRSTGRVAQLEKLAADRHVEEVARDRAHPVDAEEWRLELTRPRVQPRRELDEPREREGILLGKLSQKVLERLAPLEEEAPALVEAGEEPSQRPTSSFLVLLRERADRLQLRPEERLVDLALIDRHTLLHAEADDLLPVHSKLLRQLLRRQMVRHLLLLPGTKKPAARCADGLRPPPRSCG